MEYLNFNADGSIQTVIPSMQGVVAPGARTTWRLNSGGDSYADSLGNVWGGDGNYSGGNTYGSSQNVSGTNDPKLYQDERWGDVTYAFPAPAGSYQVTLKFAELFWTAAAKRVFNVSINGSQVLGNFDIFAEVGALKADDKVFNNIAPKNGQIVIQLGPASADNATLDAIQIIPMPGNSTPSATQTRTASPSMTVTMTPSAAKAVPGCIEAEDYVNAFDTSAGNTGGAYRSGDVDIEACAEGGFDVGWTADGEWLDYSINVASAGNYDITLRTASNNASGGSVQFLLDGAALGSAQALPGTAGWQTYQTVTFAGRSFSAGVHTLRLSVVAGGANYNWICIQPSGGAATATRTPTATRTATPASSATRTVTPTLGPTSGIPVGQYISLQAQANGLYVSANCQGCNLIANKSSVGNSEKFFVQSQGGDTVALRALMNSQWVCAENAGANPLIANRPAAGSWETFQWVPLGNGKIALKATVNSMYVCADNAGANPLIANRTAVGGWETYTVLLYGPNGTNAPVLLSREGLKPTPDDGLLAGKSMLVGPNPARDSAQVLFRMDEAGDARISFAGINGDVVLRKELGDQAAGRQQVAVDISGLASGLYIVVLEEKNSSGWQFKSRFKLAVIK